jgi:hypothetical protein
MRTIVGQLATGVRRRRRSADVVATVLHTLTSFETFDTLAGPIRSPEEVTPLIQQLARGALSMRATAPPR